MSPVGTAGEGFTGSCLLESPLPGSFPPGIQSPKLSTPSTQLPSLVLSSLLQHPEQAWQGVELGKGQPLPNLRKGSLNAQLSGRSADLHCPYLGCLLNWQVLGISLPPP